MLCVASQVILSPFVPALLRLHGPQSQISIFHFPFSSLTPLFSALPYKIRLTPLFTAFTYSDAGVGMASRTILRDRGVRPSDVQTFRPSDVQTFRRSDVQMFRRSDVPTFRRSDLHTFRTFTRSDRFFHSEKGNHVSNSTQLPQPTRRGVIRALPASHPQRSLPPARYR